MPPAGPQAQGWTGSARAATVSWLRWGFILSPSARTGPSRLGPAGEGRSDGGVLHLHPRGQARYPEGGRRREDEPPGEGVARTRHTEDDEHQGGERQALKIDSALVSRLHLSESQLLRAPAYGQPYARRGSVYLRDIGSDATAEYHIFRHP
jgi:hypothetical protein